MTKIIVSITVHLLINGIKTIIVHAGVRDKTDMHHIGVRDKGNIRPVAADLSQTAQSITYLKIHMQGFNMQYTVNRKSKQ